MASNMTPNVTFWTDKSRPLRTMFYFVSPQEMMPGHVDDVPDYVDEALPLMLLFMLLEFFIASWKGVKTLRVNDLYSSAASGLVQRSSRLVITTGELAVYIWVYNNYNCIELPIKSHATWWLCFIGIDFGYYWFHRAVHEINIFWAFHQAHHSSEDYNTSVAVRQGMFQFHISWILPLPLALAVPPSIYLVHKQLNLLYQFWIHTELIENLGPLELILNTPSHHRVHHGRNPYCLDKNYGGTLIIWDRMFGTFQAESDEKVVYGLVHPVNSWNVLYLQLFYFYEVWKRFWDIEGWKNKISVLLKGPGWTPGSPWCGNPEDVPEIEYPVTKYDQYTSRKRSVYLIIHSILIVIAYSRLVDKAEKLSYFYNTGFFSFLLLTVTSISAIAEGKWYGPAMESCRCAIFILIDLLFYSQGHRIGVVPVPLVDVIRGIFILSTFTWMFVAYNDSRSKYKEHEA